LGVEFSFSSFLFHKTVAIVVDVAADDICSTTNKQTKKNNNNIHLLFILWRCELQQTKLSSLAIAILVT
jgi:hypothetical protein